MKKIHRMKVCTFTVFILVLLLSALDYMLVFQWGQPDQKLWPIYNWSLGFEKISTKIVKGHVEVNFCDSPLEHPLSIKEFVIKSGVNWQSISHYKHLLFLTAQYYYNGGEDFTKAKKAFEADLLSKLPCHKISYSMFVIEKNLITKQENKFFLKAFEYEKL